jgi:hypothetical protein
MQAEVPPKLGVIATVVDETNGALDLETTGQQTGSKRPSEKLKQVQENRDGS